VTAERYSLWRERPDPAAPFTVCAMFTPDYRDRAERLAGSLDRFALAHALFEVPQIHRSISPKGSETIDFSKPRFIAAMLRRFGRPVLYVDSDMVFRKFPALIGQLCRQDCDFAIYNWLADSMNDAWRPDDPRRRFWKFYFSVEASSDNQLMASGGVQLWKGGGGAFALLEDWEQSLLDHPRSEDDHCLDYAYNHGDRAGLNPHWLPKQYCRCAFWPYADAVIDHPEFPSPITDQFEQLGSARLDRDRVARVHKQPPFPRDAILDAETRQLLMPAPGGRYAPAGPLPLPLYLGDA
jgi:hypothetical protein